mgnify:CR=1 FL=1
MHVNDCAALFFLVVRGGGGGGGGCLCVGGGVNIFNRSNFPGKVCNLFILLPNFVVNLSL